MPLHLRGERARYRTGSEVGGLEVGAVQGAEEQAVRPVEVVELDPEPASVGRARRFVTSCLDRWSLGGLASDACLVVSELVSNAVIHARTPIELRVRTLDGGVRIEVRDGVEHGFGAAREDRDFPGHGLGLRVVAQLASRWGVDPVPDGKVVWAVLCRLGAEGPQAPELGLWPAPLPLPDDWPEVRLLDVPTRLLRGWEAHTGELIREFSLLAPVSSAGGDPPSSPGFADGAQDRVATVKAVLERFWELVRPVWALAHAPGRRDPCLLAVVTRLPERIVLDARRVLDAFDDADALASEGRLLTGPTPPEIAEFGRWFVEAAVRQVVEGSGAGGARCPFPP